MLFNEIYGKYYHILYRLLTMSANGPISEGSIKDVILEDGYDESLLHLYPKLVEESSSDYYQLLRASEDGGYESNVFYKPERHLTLLEKMWLRVMMEDKRCCLFFGDRQRQVIMDSLEGGIEPCTLLMHIDT